MIGHAERLTTTNRGAMIPLCECGWIGNVTPMEYKRNPRTGREVRQRELTATLALDQHRAHLAAVSADIARVSDDALAQHGRMIDLANATLQRRGRWGNA